MISLKLAQTFCHAIAIAGFTPLRLSLVGNPAALKFVNNDGVPGIQIRARR